MTTELQVITASKTEMATVIETGQIAVIKQIIEEGNVDPILGYFKDKLADLKAENLDPNNKKDRERMRSFAASIGKSKKPIVDMAGDLQGEVESKAAHFLDSIKNIKGGVKEFKIEMDKMRDEAKHFAVKWDADEKIRTTAHTDKIAQMKTSVAVVNLEGVFITAELLKLKLDKFIAFKNDKLNAEICEEYLPEYEMVVNDAIEKFTVEFIPQAEKRESDEAELQVLRKKQAESAAIELADKNARATALQATQDLEDEKLRSKQREDQLKLDAENKLKQDKIDADNAEKLRIKTTADAETKRLAGIEQARIDTAREIQEEKDRQQKIADKKSADTDHQRTINREAVADMQENGYTYDEAVKFLTLVAKNKIRNLTINY